eukprot:gnl/TRDRNA2_/TRDRNA2_154132_c0_seq1.p1 gnl/TRDRNA2_/TRDRNA2_154132_c0~~gnl/TRDRNA2_/TRDRNA2_154132_c0_seq1.p1  ORF type:complete len:334 (-),score=57.10 gnl/TRDRNA2_/TRDRNA2_154132_c0_seq1:157-1071(-)
MWTPQQAGHRKLQLGDLVLVRGLASDAGQRLNGREGRIRKYDSLSGRFGVQIKGAGLKAIKAENLVIAHDSPSRTAELGNFSAAPSSPPAPADVSEPEGPTTATSIPSLLVDGEELSSQFAIEASLQEAANRDFGQGVLEVNAQVSDALVHGDATLDCGPHVLLLKFSRDPVAVHEALSRSPELIACSEMLASHGFDVQLQSGAKVFVTPEMYEPVKEAIELGKWVLKPRHVIVEPKLYSVVADIAEGVDKGEKVKVRREGVVPLSFAAAAARMEKKPVIQKTFISVRMPNSLCSFTDAGPRTV